MRGKAKVCLQAAGVQPLGFDYPSACGACRLHPLQDNCPSAPVVSGKQHIPDCDYNGRATHRFYCDPKHHKPSDANVTVAIWYVLFSRYNRRRGTVVLQWVESACAARGRVVETRWLSASSLQAHFSFATHWFENARITIKLIPRPIPIQWAICLWRRQKETLTFEADLDYSPNFQLEISRHRWLTQRPKEISNPERNWTDRKSTRLN